MADLYRNAVIINYKEGDQSLERTPEVMLKSDGDITYTIKEGDTLQAISFRFYGDSDLWYRLADVNGYYNPFEELEIGDEIIIPNGRQ